MRTVVTFSHEPCWASMCSTVHADFCIASSPSGRGGQGIGWSLSARITAIWALYGSEASIVIVAFVVSSGYVYHADIARTNVWNRGNRKAENRPQATQTYVGHPAGAPTVRCSLGERRSCQPIQHVQWRLSIPNVDLCQRPAYRSIRARLPRRDF